MGPAQNVASGSDDLALATPHMVVDDVLNRLLGAIVAGAGRHSVCRRIGKASS
jgi:hypothetical protein